MDYEKYFKIMNDSPTEDTLNELASIPLSDFMVPLDVMIEQMQKVEACENIGLSFKFIRRDVNGEINERGALSESGLFTVPYPNTQPCCPEYVDSELSDLTNEDINRWIRVINRFLGPIIQNALRIQDLAKISSSEDCGVILHMYSGAIERFDYNELVSLDAVYCPEILPELIGGYVNNDQMTRSSVVDGFNVMFFNPSDDRDPKDDAIRTFYQFRYRNRYGDRFNTDNSYTVLCPYGITLPTAVTWTSYIHDMIQRRAKVIVFP